MHAVEAGGETDLGGDHLARLMQGQRKRAAFKRRLRCRHADDGASGNRGEEVESPVDDGGESERQGLDLVDNDDRAGEGLKPAQASRMRGEQRMEELHERGDHYGARPTLNERVAQVIVWGGIGFARLRDDVAVVLEEIDGSFDRFAPFLGVLREDGLVGGKVKHARGLRGASGERGDCEQNAQGLA